mmetsp:Transcript_23652/g.60288  ORF Transcript_23652/g.60288 Transcript_23652/m.60288 type:complete len:600 (-) Transcript_23652:70-1869(-)
MALGCVDLGRLHGELLEHGPPTPLLRRAAGRRERGGAPVLVHMATRKHREVSRLGVPGPELRGSGPHRLAPRVAVCGGVVGEAAAEVGVHACCTATNVGQRADAQIDPTHDRTFARVVVLVLEVQLRGVLGHEGGGAGGVDGHARSAQVQAIVEAVGRDGVGAVRGSHGTALALRDVPPLVLVQPDECGDVRGLGDEALLRVAGTLERDEGHLQDVPLRGVHASSLHGRDVEELAVEQVHPLEEASVARVGLAHHRVRVLLVVHGDIPAGVGMPRLYVEVGLRVAEEQLPRLVRAEGVARAQGDHGRLLPRFRLRSTGATADQIQRAAEDAADGEVLRWSHEQRGASQRLTLRLKGPLVPLHCEHHRHAGCHRDGPLRHALAPALAAAVAAPNGGLIGGLAIVVVGAARDLACARQDGGRRPGVEDGHELGPTKQHQKTCRVSVGQLRRFVVVLLSALERQRQQRRGPGPQLEAQCLAREGPQDLAQGGEGFFREAQGRVLNKGCDVTALQIQSQSLGRGTPAQVALLNGPRQPRKSSGLRKPVCGAGHALQVGRREQTSAARRPAAGERPREVLARGRGVRGRAQDDIDALVCKYHRL